MKTTLIILVIIATTALCRAEPFNYAQYWQSLPAEARDSYLDGVVDGINFAFEQAASEWLEKDDRYLARREPVRKKVFPMFEKKTLLPVMADLYRDPANAFLDPLAILYLSRDKLLGSDITRALVDARKRAIETYELNRRIKSQ